MKSRSHRPPMFDPRHDDWGDGSWIVDCICGVNFDDGEEMVKCDECGIWEHTRCSRYVKSEKSFSCDKCKSKNGVCGGGSGLRNNSEETEVAEFLVELPTKAMLDSPNLAVVSSDVPIPMEKRVHVQGVPGGESGFFASSKMSSVFGPELWKGAGYVPKQFNFRYTEFACLNHGEVEEKIEAGMDNEMGEGKAYQPNNVALSFSKDDRNPLPASIPDPVSVSCPAEVPQARKSNVENLDLSGTVDSIGVETTSFSVNLDSAKYKKEHMLRIAGKDANTENQISRDSEAGLLSCVSPQLVSNEAKNSDFSQEKDLQVSSCSPRECATNLVLKGQNLDHCNASEVGNNVLELPRRHETFSKSRSLVKPINKHAQSCRTPVKEEVRVDCPQSCDDIRVTTGGMEFELPKNSLAGGFIVGGQGAGKTEVDENPGGDMAVTRPKKRLKRELGDAVDDHRIESLPHIEMDLNRNKVTTEYGEYYGNVLCEGIKQCKVSAMSSESNDSKLHYASDNPTVDSKTDKSDQSPADSYGPKLDPTTSEVCLGPLQKSIKCKNGTAVPDKMLKLNGDSQRHSSSHQHKVKSISTSGSIMSNSSDDHVSLDGRSVSARCRHKDLSEGRSGNMKNNAVAGMFEHSTKSGRPKKIGKETSVPCSISKVPDSSKFSHISNSKGSYSDSKDFTFSSSVASNVGNVACRRVSDDGVSQSLIFQDKISDSVVPSKGQKIRPSSTQTSSKGNLSSAPAALSDEELALLLHQELNSSSRVPRVTRMRHAGSSPQITCSSAASMLTKRSSSGGKDQIVSYRKKSKDFSGEGSHGNPRTTNHEVKKVDRRSSPDNTRQDSACSIDQRSQKEDDCGSIKHVQSMKKTYPSSCLSSDNYARESSSNCPSARNASEDGPHMVRYRGHLTLPGLIAEIMSEGKRMTYEELCNAVLPHWPSLRKHNGDRYAYSSHSQAVLDCLRNRSEWARLVDRGPKTNASRKRRNNEVDSLSMESDENEEIGAKNERGAESKKSVEPHQEDIPKGKRKARRRRGPVLQERGVMTRGRKAEIISDSDETDSCSDSSEDDEDDDDVSSEDEEAQGDGASAEVSDASTDSE